MIGKYDKLLWMVIIATCLALFPMATHAMEQWDMRYRPWFDRNLRKIKLNEGPFTTEQKTLMNYFENEMDAKNRLWQHNWETFMYMKNYPVAKMIIPYHVHFLWVTDPQQPEIMPYQNVWDVVRGLMRDIEPLGFNYRISFQDYLNDMGDAPEEYGIQWEFTFWTNVNDSIRLDKEACQGHCEVRLINELPGYDEIARLVDQFLGVRYYNIDLLKAYILEEHGGVYLDCDYNFNRSSAYLHRLMDMYTATEGPLMDGLTTGAIAAKKGHQAIKVWKDLLLEWYGFRPDGVWGVNKFFPMPVERESFAKTSGPRFWGIAVWASRYKYGNNDAIFKATIFNVRRNHRTWKDQRVLCGVLEYHQEQESIHVYMGAIRDDCEHMTLFYRFKQFGWQRNIQFWKYRPRLYWTQRDTGEERRKIYLMDVTDREDILAPMRNTRANLAEMAARYTAKNRMSAIYFNDYLREYYRNTNAQVYGADMPQIGLPDDDEGEY